MSAPKIIAQVVILGSQILTRAFIQAWKQAARNAKASSPAGLENGSGPRAGSDRLFNMSLGEAEQILNLKKGAALEESELQKMLKNFDHLFKANEPMREGKPHSSHYLQSKIIRAKERIEAELFAGKAAEGGAQSAEATAGKSGPAP